MPFKSVNSFMQDFSANNMLFLNCGVGSHALLTRSPLFFFDLNKKKSVRLACVRPIASVHSEPGSNSHGSCAKPKGTGHKGSAH